MSIKNITIATTILVFGVIAYLLSANYISERHTSPVKELPTLSSEKEKEKQPAKIPESIPVKPMSEVKRERAREATETDYEERTAAYYDPLYDGPPVPPGLETKPLPEFEPITNDTGPVPLDKR